MVGIYNKLKIAGYGIVNTRLVRNNSRQQCIGIGQQHGVDAASGHSTARIGDGGPFGNGEGFGQPQLLDGPLAADRPSEEIK